MDRLDLAYRMLWWVGVALIVGMLIWVAAQDDGHCIVGHNEPGSTDFVCNHWAPKD